MQLLTSEDVFLQPERKTDCFLCSFTIKASHLHPPCLAANNETLRVNYSYCHFLKGIIASFRFLLNFVECVFPSGCLLLTAFSSSLFPLFFMCKKSIHLVQEHHCRQKKQKNPPWFILTSLAVTQKYLYLRKTQSAPINSSFRRWSCSILSRTWFSVD